MAGAHQDRIDAAMLRSMALTIQAGMDFSFNPKDMAETLLRAADRIEPKLRLAGKGYD
jgi:hypothetical protein